MSYWDMQDTYNIIEKYAPVTGITRTEIDSFGVRRRQRTIRDTTVLEKEGRIRNIGTAQKPRYVVTEPKPCDKCGRP